MPPKRKTTTKSALSDTASRADNALLSPVSKPMVDIQLNHTPLLERLHRRSSEGKQQLELDMSGKSSLQHGESPAWKKSRDEVSAYSTSAAIVQQHNVQMEKMMKEVEQLRSELELESAARMAAEDELSRRSPNKKKGAAATVGSTNNSATASIEKELVQLRQEINGLKQSNDGLVQEVAQLQEEKKQLEEQIDDTFNQTLISFKSPGVGRKSGAGGRLSLSGYADEFASSISSVDLAQMDLFKKKVAELENVVNLQASEIERLVRKGSLDDSIDIKGMDDKVSQLHEDLESERQQTTQYREEISRLSGQLDAITSERNVLSTRVRKYQEDELAYDATSAELESLQVECISMRSEIESYKKRCFGLDQAVEQLGKQVEVGKNQIFSLEDRIKTAERDLEQSQAQNSAQEQVFIRKNTVLNTELNNSRAEIRKLRDENGDAKTLNHKLKQENIDLSTNLQRWTVRANEFEAKYHESENEAKRARVELESIKRETSILLRNAENREQEAQATLADNQTEMCNMSTELRNVKQERDHLQNQIRNLSEQIHEMKLNSTELVNETQKKHEAELSSLRHKSSELESLLQNARREKNHYENQFKALTKQGAVEAQSALARVKELEQALEAQKKLNLRLQKEASASGAVGMAELPSAATAGKPVAVLGSPAVDLGERADAAVERSADPIPVQKRALQTHVSAVAPPAQPAQPSVLQRHPSAPVVVKPAASVQSVSPAPQNPLAFWKAKINNGAVANPATTTTPRVLPPIADPVVKNATPVPAALVRTPLSRRVNEIQSELAAEEISPIFSAVGASQLGATHITMLSVDEPVEDVTPRAGVMVSQQSRTPRSNTDLGGDLFMKHWATALADKPESWKNALSSTAAKDTFQFGSKTVQCRLIGNDMLVQIADGGAKSQTLVHNFLEQFGPEVDANGANSELSTNTGANSQINKKPTVGGLRFKNLRKQPLGNSNLGDNSSAS